MGYVNALVYMQYINLLAIKYVKFAVPRGQYYEIDLEMELPGNVREAHIVAARELFPGLKGKGTIRCAPDEYGYDVLLNGVNIGCIVAT